MSSVNSTPSYKLFTEDELMQKYNIGFPEHLASTGGVILNTCICVDPVQKIYAMSTNGQRQHHHVYEWLKQSKVGRKFIECEWRYGFVTSEGRWVNRRDAMTIAVAANQVRPQYTSDSELTSVILKEIYV